MNVGPYAVVFIIFFFSHVKLNWRLEGQGTKWNTVVLVYLACGYVVLFPTFLLRFRSLALYKRILVLLSDGCV